MATDQLSLVTTVVDHTAAEEAIRRLSAAGFPIDQLSIVGRGYHTEEHPVGFFTKGDRIVSWGGGGALWGGLWGLTLGAAGLFLLPPVGAVALAGPLATLLATALEGAAVGGGAGALAAAFVDLGLPREAALQVETELKADRFLILIHGPEADAARARDVLGADLIAPPIATAGA